MQKTTPTTDEHWIHVISTKSQIGNDALAFSTQEAAIEAAEMIQSHNNTKIYFHKIRYFYGKATMRDVIRMLKIAS